MQVLQMLCGFLALPIWWIIIYYITIDKVGFITLDIVMFLMQFNKILKKLYLNFDSVIVNILLFKIEKLKIISLFIFTFFVYFSLQV